MVMAGAHPAARAQHASAMRRFLAACWLLLNGEESARHIDFMAHAIGITSVDGDRRVTMWIDARQAYIEQHGDTTVITHRPIELSAFTSAWLNEPFDAAMHP